MILPGALLLSGCALLAEGGLLEAAAVRGVAVRAAAGEGAALATARAGAGMAASEVAAARGASFFVDGSVASAESGPLGRAITALAERRAPMVLRDGVVQLGSRDVAALQGAELLFEGRSVGYLRDGLMIDAQSGVQMGRLRGFIPRNGAELELSNGMRTTTVRSLFVDILEHSDRGYLIRLASGETAHFAGTFSAVALTAAAVADHCDPLSGNGFAVRYSGELVPFNTCEEDEGTFTLGTSNDAVIVDRNEIAGLLYMSEEAASNVPRET